MRAQTRGRLSEELATAAAAVHGSGRAPLAVLDVDLTLVDNAPRNRAIWGAWCHEVRDRLPDAAATAERAQTMPIVFGVMDNLETLGITDADLRQEGLRYWLQAFFSDAWLGADVPLPGAVDAVRALCEAEVTIVYLTARPARMIEGTVASLRRFGLPVGVPGTVLAMKPRHDEPDGAFKEGALGWIARLGGVVLCADNEPGHVNAMHDAFPRALALHVATRHSAGAPSLHPGVRVVKALSDGVLRQALTDDPER